MHPVVELAREAVEEHVRTGRVIEPPSGLSGVLAERAGVFVSLKKHGQLRGCIGTITPVTSSVAHETVRNAVAAATQDTRFLPVDIGELEGLEYSVDVLTPPEPVREKSQLDPGKYGVIVSKGTRKGLLLPDLKGVETVEEQLRIASLKAGIDPHGEDIRIERFEVMRYR
jgi:AmmeMemoRadiSam system protein A